MDKRAQLFDRLNNHFYRKNEFPELSQISDEDIDKIIALYEKEASKGGKDPWNYLNFNDLIIMQRCVYEVIKDKPEYREITKKVEELYFDELDRRLQRTVYYYGEPTDKTYRSTYANMPEESIVLADMCTRRMQELQSNASNMDDETLEQMEKMYAAYEEIETDFAKDGLSMPEEQDRIAQQMKMAIEDKKESIRQELQQAIEEAKQIIEWAKQQPNVPKFTYVGNDSPERQQEVFDQAYERMQNSAQRLNNESIPLEYQSAYNQATDQFRERAEQDIKETVSKEKPPVSEEPVQPEPIIEEEQEQPEIDPAQMEAKNKLINDVVSAMINAGEFHDSGSDMGKRMRDIEYVKKQLETKSVEDLEWALSVYGPPQEELNSENGKHR